MTAFIVVYMFASPIFAMLSDRGFSRRYLLMSGDPSNSVTHSSFPGVILWSLATGLTFFAVDFWSFLSFRTLVGVGEAAYATIAPGASLSLLIHHLRDDRQPFWPIYTHLT